jgi:hypothetical protein
MYKVLRNDDGWAYEVNGTFSETFRTREEARRAARLAAQEQAFGKHEVAGGEDRSKTVVKE